MDEPGIKGKPRQPEDDWATVIWSQRKKHIGRNCAIGFAVTLVLAAFLIGPSGKLEAPDGTVWLQLLGAVLLVLVALIGEWLPVLAPLLLVVAVWAIARRVYRKSAREEIAGDAGGPSPLETEKAMLEALRASLTREARVRLWLMVPLGFAAGMSVFSVAGPGLPQRGIASRPHSALTGFMLIGGMFAWAGATIGPNLRYAKAFKAQILPQLLSPHAVLTHTIGVRPDLERSVEAGLFPAHDTVAAHDGFSGTYRGHPIRITHIGISRRIGDKDDVLFQGLYGEIIVPTPFRGTTLLHDKDLGPPGAGLEPLRLNAPRVESVHAAWTSDPVEACSILDDGPTERLLAIADGTIFQPRLLLDKDRMVFALSCAVPGRLFEPPDLATSVSLRQLAGLKLDLAPVFGLIDAMIDMHVAPQRDSR